MNLCNGHGELSNFAACPWPSPKRMHGNRQAGFSLIELMIVVAIIAVLAALAYPAYQQYIIKTNRKAAESCLAEELPEHSRPVRRRAGRPAQGVAEREVSG